MCWGAEVANPGGEREEGVLRLDRRGGRDGRGAAGAADAQHGTRARDRKGGGDSGDGLVLRHSFEGQPGSVGLARAAAKHFLGALEAARPPADAQAVGDILLAVSELVTNVVRHTAGPGLLVMTHQEGAVRIVVRDTGTACVPPPGRVPRLDGRGGLGWPMLRALATALTVVPLPDGKEIHADLPWPARREAP